MPPNLPRLRFAAIAAAALFAVQPAIAAADSSLDALRALATTLDAAGHRSIGEVDRDWLGWEIEICEASGQEKTLRVSGDGRTIRNAPHGEADDRCDAGTLEPTRLAALADRLALDRLHDVEEVDIDEGIIEVEARDAAGQSVERRYRADTLEALTEAALRHDDD